MWRRASYECCGARRHDQRRAKHENNGDGWVPLEHVITKDIFKAEVHAWPARIGVEVKGLHFRPLTRK
jgi:hypothetical protein